MKITFGELYHNNHTLQEYAQQIQLKASKYSHIIPPMTEISSVKALDARICHGMIICECPDCKGAEIVWLKELFFMCSSCFNARVHGKWRKVKIPKNLDLIIATLERRPVHLNRNWDSTETLDDLIKENEIHKDEIF
jgi:hypothetical protein